MNEQRINFGEVTPRTPEVFAETDPFKLSQMANEQAAEILGIEDALDNAHAQYPESKTGELDGAHLYIGQVGRNLAEVRNQLASR
ncbi:MAG TPA: hypothetical protein VLA77_02235 [Candidatus Saccharimonadales bacterium]|nr:hypothetical protein [Candidatus Saccharimonadales bacterium]